MVARQKNKESRIFLGQFPGYSFSWKDYPNYDAEFLDSTTPSQSTDRLESADRTLSSIKLLTILSDLLGKPAACCSLISLGEDVLLLQEIWSIW
jgi:hypothetical protein